MLSSLYHQIRQFITRQPIKSLPVDTILLFNRVYRHIAHPCMLDYFSHHGHLLNLCLTLNFICCNLVAWLASVIQVVLLVVTVLALTNLSSDPLSDFLNSSFFLINFLFSPHYLCLRNRSRSRAAPESFSSQSEQLIVVRARRT